MSVSQAATVYSIVPPYASENILSYYQKDYQNRHEAFPTEKPDQKISLQQQSNETINEVRDMRAVENGSQRPVLGYLHPAPREVWDASDAKKPPQLVLSTKSKPPHSPDAYAISCNENMSKVDNFCRDILKIYSVNTSTHLMKAYVHDAKAFNNAFWHSGTQDIHFGEVDPAIFKPLVHDFGITMHEFGHAITQYSSNLMYKEQSGALNESMSDIFAIMAEHYMSKAQANKPDTNWLIGKDLVINSRGTGTALRSMDKPGSAYKNHIALGSDPQPDHMRDYKTMRGDNGGVHYNSGIPNKAFYLAASSIGGGSWEKTGQVWFKTLLEAKTNYDFMDFANHTVKVAQREYGGEVSNLVGQAWSQIGVTPTKSPTANSPTALNNPPIVSKWARDLILGGGGIAMLSVLMYTYNNTDN